MLRRANGALSARYDQQPVADGAGFLDPRHPG
jgi:hypothetical protein